jgi:hypothetical protein
MTTAKTSMVHCGVPRWDARVTDAAGKPVPAWYPPWSRRWFIIRRAAGEAGVTLETRIPGWPSGIAKHDNQAAAEMAARETWRGYAAEVTRITGREQESEPWTS